MDIVLYALTALLYGGLAVAGWRSHRHSALAPVLESVPRLPATPAASAAAVAKFSTPGRALL
ncbi:MAG TPA: inner membrane protein YpjD, partial [Trinickia sp.]|nr:inner membrane protein YpjD [Trinickia sp.]